MIIADEVELFILLGLVSFVVEIFFVPGLGLLFLGMGAFSTAGVIYLFPNMLEYEYVFLGVLSSVWFMFLWGPLKHYVYDRTERDPIFSLVGSEVEVVDSDIIPGMIGKVRWSGTIMNAKLSHGMDQKVSEGSFLDVVEVRGNILMLGPLNLRRVKKD